MTGSVIKIDTHDRIELIVALRSAIASYRSHYEVCISRNMPSTAADWLTRANDAERILNVIENAVQLTAVAYPELDKSNGD